MADESQGRLDLTLDEEESNAGEPETENEHFQYYPPSADNLSGLFASLEGRGLQTPQKVDQDVEGMQN